VYGFDFGARGLDMLEELPHVGSIITGGDHERISRLLSDLRSLIDERAARYAKAKAGTITEYRVLTGTPDEPRILLLLDGVAAFRTAYEATDKIRWYELFQSIAVDGRPVGVHVALSADRPAAIPMALGSAIQRRIVLRLAEEGDYGTLGEAADVFASATPPGRGIVDGAEVQIAILGGTRNTLQQAQAVSGLADSMRKAGVPTAPAVESLSNTVKLETLPNGDSTDPVFGLSGTHLGPATFPATGVFLLTGPPASGRSTALETLVCAVRRATPDALVHYVGNRRSALAAIPGLGSVSTDAAMATAMATRLTGELEQHRSRQRVVLVLEGLSDLVNGPADLPLQQLVKVLLADDHLVLAEGESTTLSSTAGLIGMVRASRTGLALQPDSYDGGIFRTDFPKLRRVDMPPGRGLLVAAGRVTLVQVALPAAVRADGMGTAPHSLVTT
jgi:S-DNA-T family DNA segregation ATPase FtsK/SpoIIIE